jgi:Tol biopolymer transport system component
MSPEQIRGDKLDARTDLFSFGLVLYEMATGKRAFAGDSTPAIQKAILEQAPQPVRKLAPRVPARLEKIVSKTLQRERAARYQSASELRSDLGVLQRHLGANRRSAKWMAAGFLALLAIAGGLWTVRERVSVPSTLRVLKQRQLTTNSSENQIKSGAISPDARYLAYADLAGIHIKFLETGKTTTVLEVESFGSTIANWDVGPWLPDSTAFMASLDNPTQPPDYWLVSFSGSLPRRIRDDINPYSYSPGGSWLVATMKEDPSMLGGSEIWIMRPDGSQARKIYEASDKSIFRWIVWSPNGQRLAYIRDRFLADGHELTFESRDLNGGSPVTMLSGADLRGFDSVPVGEQQFVWLPDGRLVFEATESGGSCPANLFEARVDKRTGALREKPKQITDWTGFCLYDLSATADGKHLALARQTEEMPIFVAGLDTVSPRMSPPSRLTLTEDKSRPMGWTRDSKAVVFASKQDGAWGIYKQRVDAATPDAVVTGLREPPDVDVAGDSLLYLHWEASNGAAAESVLTRISSSGVSQEVLRGNFNGFGCGWSHDSGCVIGELADNNREIVFTALDPLKGRGRQLVRFRDEHAPDGRVDDLYWRLSPDGKRVALVKQFEGRIRLLSLEWGSVQQIDVKAGAHIRPFDWAADGKGFFASVAVQQGAQLAYIDLKGNLRSLWQDNGYNAGLIPRPAPDGRQIAIGASRQTTNFWMIDDF